MSAYIYITQNARDKELRTLESAFYYLKEVLLLNH